MSIESQGNYIVTECEARGYYAFPRDSMRFINRATIVARLINAIETVLRCITHFYHAKRY